MSATASSRVATAGNSTETSVNGADAMVRLLEAHGTTHVFGLCGDTSLPLYDSFQRLDHGITHVLTRDERSAAYMADAYARISGKVGVCEGPSGGGATYILPGLVEANESSVPVLGITTDVSVGSRGRFTLTELDQESLFRPLCKWNAVIDRSDLLPNAVRRAFRSMVTGRPGAVHLGLPLDVQRGAVDADDLWAQDGLGTYPAWRTGPDPLNVSAAAELILASKRPMIICGGGVKISGAETELERLASRFAIPVATTISGKGSIAETHPLAVGVIGSNGGTPMTRDVVSKADLVIFIGCRAGSVTTEKWTMPRHGTRTVHIDADPNVVGVSYQSECVLVGDARLSLSALNAVLADGEGRQCREDVAGEVLQARRAKFDVFDSLATDESRPIRPERVVAALRNVLDDDAIIVADPGTPCPYFSAYFEQRVSGRRFITNRAHGALGYSLPASVGAWYAKPDAKVVSVMGDGSFGFTCGELETVVRMGAPITFVVFSNSSYGWIKAGQKTSYNGRYFGVDFDRTDHARVAQAFGVKSWRVEDPTKLESVLKDAVSAGEPTLVDIVSQPLHEANAPVSEWIV